MMIALLKTSFAAEHAHATEATDHGSEPRNFDTQPLDTKELCAGQLDDDFDGGFHLQQWQLICQGVFPVRLGLPHVQQSSSERLLGRCMFELFDTTQAAFTKR